MNGFHDYRIGSIDYNGDSAHITIEEVIPEKKIQDSTGLVWDFCFEGISMFSFSVDCVMGFWILDVENGKSPGEILFNLDSGIILIAAEKVILGIPSPMEK